MPVNLHLFCRPEILPWFLLEFIKAWHMQSKYHSAVFIIEESSSVIKTQKCTYRLQYKNKYFI